jgi:hypothetical protein
MTARPADADPAGHAAGEEPGQGGGSPSVSGSARRHDDGRAELKVEFEITTLGGEADRQLAAQQAAAIRDALVWLAQNSTVDPATAQDV